MTGNRKVNQRHINTIKYTKNILKFEILKYITNIKANKSVKTLTNI